MQILFTNISTVITNNNYYTAAAIQDFFSFYVQFQDFTGPD